MSEWDKTARGLEAIGAEKQGIRNVNCERIGSSDWLDALEKTWQQIRVLLGHEKCVDPELDQSLRQTHSLVDKAWLKEKKRI